MLLLILLFVVLGLLSIGGGVGYSRFGILGFSPAAIILIVMIILYATGHIHLR